ncbi:MAG: hypothetical protein IJT18_03875 [Oscillospiraceae bacterium]|nr:hypothetical protein [Oscillospiraceae bacterium]
MQESYYTTGGGRPPVPQPQTDGAQRSEGMVQALQMLLRSGLSGLVDFGATAFWSDTFLVGSALVQPTAAAAYDNLDDTLTASFGGFTPCACEFIDVTGTLYLAVGAGVETDIPVTRLALEDVDGVAFAAVAGDYQSARALMSRILHPASCRDACPPYPDPCCEPCDPDFPAVGRTVALVTGPVVIVGAVMLGRIGDVLVLANDTDERFYFIDADKAQIIR